jgi:predicted transposase YbfD/YdcC
MAMGCIRSARIIKGVVTTELRYYLTALTDAAAFARSVRTHWGIENKPRWMLDVAFREDYARNGEDHSAANLAIIRKITLNLIRLEPAEEYHKQKFSLNRKRLYASYEPDFLFNILTQFIMRLPWRVVAAPLTYPINRWALIGRQNRGRIKV